jgi:hypothetical protein
MERNIGKVIRVEYDTKTKEMILVLNVEDPDYKKRILRDFKNSDKLIIKGETVMAVVGRKEK